MPDIDKSFVKQFESEVHLSYQRLGSKLRPTVRSKKTEQGASTVFQKMGRGAASTKARHAAVPVMNVEHSTVEVFLKDYYAGEWLDALDEIKTAGDERSALVNSGAYALGRKTDELIIEALNTSTNFAGLNTDGLTKAKILTAFEKLGGQDVPDDGERTAVIGWKQWSELLAIDEGPDEPLFFVFADATTGRETYGAARFLYADRPVGGKVIRDCNRAYNPPCAFTPFSTCPLPPAGTVLPFRITAGEKTYPRADP